MFRSSNPALNPKVFQEAQSFGMTSGNTMTIQGTTNKTLILLALVLVTASWVWSKVFAPAPILGDDMPAPQAAVGGYMMLGAIGGFIMAIVTAFKKEWAPYTAPIYALLEGLFIGGISALFEKSMQGIVIQATALTFGTLFCMLMAYKSGMIKVTDKFRRGVVGAVGAICLLYFVNIIMGFFGSSMSFIHGGGTFGIGFSLFVVAIAAVSLTLDFDMIERASSANLPKYMEWYGAFALMVTLIWLYIEILRLLAKSRQR